MKCDYEQLRLRQIYLRKRIALSVILTALLFVLGFIAAAVVSAGTVLSLRASLFLAAGLFIVILYAQISLRDLDIEERSLRRKP